MKTTCVVVIGHVDHGKTTLVRALTGIDTDRLAEEKARGLSITPGFAHVDYGSGIIDLIDAPGHQDFTQAMVAGASGADAILAVISAVEGIGAQTVEHLRIAENLGLSQAVIAVTKSDALPQEEQDAAVGNIRQALSETAFNNAPMILCSAVTGSGINTLHRALEALIFTTHHSAGPQGCYLPIDRAFTLQGHGTIVTGTLLGQPVQEGDTLVLEPKGTAVTIRGLQSRGVARDKVHPGERVAVNVRGASPADVSRGSALCSQAMGSAATCLDCHVELHAGMGRPLRHMEKVRIHFGTSSEVAEARLFGGGELGRAGLVQFRFTKQVMAFAGQRAVLRRLSPPQTIGGAVILDPQASPTGTGNKGRLNVLKAAHSGHLPDIAAALCLADNGAARLSDIARLGQVRVDQVLRGLGNGFARLKSGFICPEHSIEALKQEVLQSLADYHANMPLRVAAPLPALGLPKLQWSLLNHTLTALVSDARIIEQNATFYALASHDPVGNLTADQLQRMAEIDDCFRSAGLVPDTLETQLNSAQDQDLVALLLHSKRLLSLQNVSLNQSLVFHTSTLHEAAKALHLAFPVSCDFTTSQARTALATSRKVIVPILEYFDRCGITRRAGNTRQMTIP